MTEADKRTMRGALVLCGLSIVAFAVGRYGVTALTLLLGVAVAGELFRIARAAGTRPVAGVGLLSVIALIVVGHTEGAAAPRWFPPIAGGGLTLAYVAMLRRHVRTNVTRGLIATAVPIVLAGVLGAFVPALTASAQHAGTGFLALVLGAGAGTAAARRAKAPLLGEFAAAALGALVVAGALAVAFPTPFEAGRAIVLACVVAACAPLGRSLAGRVAADLSARASDAGAPTTTPRALVLGRVGGAILAAPVYFYVLRALIT